MALEASFDKRKSEYLLDRHERVARAAQLSPIITAISFEGREGRLSFVYDTREVRPVTSLKEDKNNYGIGVVEDSTMSPGITDFDHAISFARRLFIYGSGWYEKPEITRETPERFW